MSEEIKHIICVDDRVSEDGIDNYVSEAFTKRFAGAKYEAFDYAGGAIEYLETNPDITHADVLLFDCCDTSYRFDTTFGYRNAWEIINWHLENAPDLPRYVLFQSSDKEFAIASAERLERETGIKCFAVDRGEYHLANQFLEGRPPSRDIESSGFREFLNQTLGLSIPTTKEAMDQWQIDNQIWEEADIVQFLEDGLITRDQALVAIHEETMRRVDDWLHPEVEVDVDDFDDEELSREERREKRWQAENLRFQFAKAVGNSVHAYAAFSLKDVEKLASEGKKSVLFMSRYDARFIPHLKDLAAVAMTTNNATGHMGILLESHGVTGLLGLQEIGERFDFLRKPSGQKLKYTQRLEGQGHKRLLASYNDTVIEQANAHEKPYYPEEGLDEGENKPKIPTLVVNLDELEAGHTLTFGDPVTVEARYGGSIYPGHHKIKESDSMRYSRWLNDVSAWLHDWQREQGLKPLRFKANINHPNQEFGMSYASGIGLLRTEHFILADNNQCEALKALCLEENASALEKISVSLANDLEGFLHANSESKVRIRLLDAPPSEFYNKTEQKTLIERYGVKSTRGVQLAEQLPSLYEAQLDGIFSAMKKAKDEEAKIWGQGENEYTEYPKGIEILIPTVRTEEELCFALKLTRESAKRIGVPDDKYRFGSMLETVDACKNIESIVSHCAFISIGTNDLTSEVFGCARDDWKKRHEFFERDGFDPFVKLHPKVLALLEEAVTKARKGNPDIEVDLCGDHAGNIESLEMLRSLKLDGVSMPDNLKNMVGLKIRYGYQEFFRHQGTELPPKPSLERHI